MDFNSSFAPAVSNELPDLNTSFGEKPEEEGTPSLNSSFVSPTQSEMGDFNSSFDYGPVEQEMTEEEADKILDKRFGKWKPIAAAGISLAEGTTLGFSGEIAAAAKAGMQYWNDLSNDQRTSFIKDYYTNLKDEDKTDQAIRTKYPIGSTLANLGGGIVPGVVAGQALTSMPFYYALISDAAMGGAMAAGMSEGSLKDSASRNKLAEDVVVGSALGGAFALGGKAIGLGYQKGKSAVVGWAGDRVLSELAKKEGANLTMEATKKMASQAAEESVLKREVLGMSKEEAELLFKRGTLSDIRAWAKTKSPEDIKALSSLATEEERKEARKYLFKRIRAESEISYPEKQRALKDIKGISKLLPGDEGLDLGISQAQPTLTRKYKFTREEINALVEQELDDAVAFKKVGSEFRSFGRQLDSKASSASKAFDAIMKDKEASELFDVYRKGRVAKGIVDTEMDQLVRDNTLTKIAMKLADARYVYHAIDQKWGTTLERSLDQLSDASTRVGGMRYLYAKQAKQLFKDAQKEGLLNQIQTNDGTYVPILSYMLDSGDTKYLRPNQEKTFDAWVNLFKSMREEANKQGLNITAIEGGYFPIRAKSTAEIIQTVKGEIDATPQFENASEGLKKQLQHIAGFPIKDEDDWFRARLLLEQKDVLNRKNKVYTRARAAFQREGDRIDWKYRESDPYKMALQWANDTFTHAQYRKTLFEMRQMQKALAKKDPMAAEYIGNHIRDVLGTREGTLAAYTKGKIEELSATNPAFKTAADHFGVLLRNMYPAFLGMNLKAVARNMVQPQMTAIGELSGNNPYATAYLTKAAFKGQAKSAAAFFTGLDIKVVDPTLARMYGVEVGDTVKGVRSISEAAHLLGLSEPRSLTEMGEAAFGKTATEKTIEYSNNVAMYLYTLSDNVNRMTTYFMAQDITSDFARGLLKMSKGIELSTNEQLATESILRLPSGYKPRLRELAASYLETESPKVADDIAKEVATYLNSKTQFQYNRIALSEYGRALGPFFSAFTKWPSSISSDVVTLVKDMGLKEGGLKVMRKYFAPFAGLVILDEALRAKGIDPKESLQAKGVIGTRGFRSWSPVDSIGAAISGEAFKSPGIGFALGAGKLAADFISDPMAIKHAIDKDGLEGYVDSVVKSKATEGTARAIVPFAPWFRFILEDMQYLMNNESKIKQAFGRKP